MKQDTFNKVIKLQVDKSLALLTKKGKEYDGGSPDRLRSFKVAAHLMDLKQTQALAGMMAKHTVSVYEMCIDPTAYDMARWEEKITDSINYLLILRAMIEEELNNETKPVL